MKNKAQQPNEVQIKPNEEARAIRDVLRKETSADVLSRYKKGYSNAGMRIGDLVSQGKIMKAAERLVEALGYSENIIRLYLRRAEFDKAGEWKEESQRLKDTYVHLINSAAERIRAARLRSGKSE